MHIFLIEDNGYINRGIHTILGLCGKSKCPWDGAYI